jgi:hypothetical protein
MRNFFKASKSAKNLEQSHKFMLRMVMQLLKAKLGFLDLGSLVLRATHSHDLLWYVRSLSSAD